MSSLSLLDPSGWASGASLLFHVVSSESAMCFIDLAGLGAGVGVGMLSVCLQIVSVLSLPLLSLAEGCHGMVVAAGNHTSYVEYVAITASKSRNQRCWLPLVLPPSDVTELLLLCALC